MPASFDGKLVVAISSRALFDLEESNRIFEEQGVNAYYRYQLEHENEVLAPGIAFALVRKLLRLNALAPAQPRARNPARSTRVTLRTANPEQTVRAALLCVRANREIRGRAR